MYIAQLIVIVLSVVCSLFFFGCGIFYFQRAYRLWIKGSQPLTTEEKSRLGTSFYEAHRNLREPDRLRATDHCMAQYEKERQDNHEEIIVLSVVYGIFLTIVSIGIIYAACMAYPHSEPGGGSLFI